jgi:hypothetical protein
MESVSIRRNEENESACRVMKLVRQYCLDFDEDMSHAFESGVA